MPYSSAMTVFVFTWALELNHSIQIYLSKCSIPEYFQLQHFSSNTLVFTRFISYDFNGATFFFAFYFMITELTGVGYSWRSLLNWLHCCPSCLSWKLWGTILDPNIRLLVYISSQWGRVPLFLQHSNREICSLKLHVYVVQPLYPLFTMWVCFISHSSMNTLEFEMH